MRTGPSERQTIAECQRGIVTEYWRSGSFCKKRDLCRSEGMCHFVAQAERHMERSSRHPGIHWTPGFDEREVA